MSNPVKVLISVSLMSSELSSRVHYKTTPFYLESKKDFIFQEAQKLQASFYLKNGN